MGFDSGDAKPLLYADLFKRSAEAEENRKCEGWCTSSSFDSSSSSGFTSPLGSELGSSESDDGDFIAELSRQMAECMLQEDEDATDSAAGDDLKWELDLNSPVWSADRNRKSGLEPKNQVPVGRGVPVSRGRGVKGGELTQQMAFQNYGGYRQREWKRKGQVGSGMQAVFLGGSGPRNGPSGTGVFLPRVANDSVERKKKPGLSTVLIPTRVLEALELHFNRFPDSAAATPHHASPREEWKKSKAQGMRHPTSFQEGVANMDEEMQRLPQEWTY